MAESHDKHAETHACDLISRQAAIDAALTYLVEYCGAAFDEDMQRMLKKRLDSLPSAQPEQKKGRWLPDNRPGGGFWVCSCCKFPSEAFAANVLYKFCPNCGADMRGEQDE